MSQLSLFAPSPSVAAAVAKMAVSGHEDRGAIFTRREVVEFMLDLVGYTTDNDLSRYRLLEPSFGHGDFLVSAIERLLQSYVGADAVSDLAESVRGFEIHPHSVKETKARLASVFSKYGYSNTIAERLLNRWLVEADYLLSDARPQYTHIVGNPPYVRQELIAGELITEYRERFPTIFDRADLYVPFIEQSLRLLADGGQLCFICSDRWMKNRYGGPLREFVSSKYHLAVYVDMVETPAFETDVIAYPAITVIVRGKGTTTHIAHRPDLKSENLALLAKALRGDAAGAIKVSSIVNGSQPWILSAPDKTELVRRLEAKFPTLEDAGCRVGIGVATGADKVFIAPFDELDVEDDRKLPLATTKDIASGKVEWLGLGVINPFGDDGKLVSLADYPQLRAYFEKHGDAVRARNVAKKSAHAWYRTIDRIYPALTRTPKLLIPDIKGAAHIVFEEGCLYPHHNLYYIVSEQWDLRALQAILQSGIANLFVSAYSVKMAGGHLRFQAQYLRRIRIPRWDTLPHALRNSLIEAAMANDVGLTRNVVRDIYGLTSEELALIETD